ncbi:MAG: hypothetical protein EXR69_14390 [Myxococcales bacterium]|nr:hypothetical protein [Myxococcales bacterium]
MILPDQTTLQLLLVLLLLVWLLTRVRTRVDLPPPRRTPVTADELGRALFEVVRNSDFVGYRGLFLAGSETRLVLGADADAYLDRRTRELLATALARLQANMPEGSHYHGFLVGDEGQGMLEARMADGAIRPVAVGIVARVGAVWRLVDPMLTD